MGDRDRKRHSDSFVTILFLKKPKIETADGYLWHLSTYLTAEHHQVLDGICSQNRSLVNCKHKQCIQTTCHCSTRPRTVCLLWVGMRWGVISLR